MMRDDQDPDVDGTIAWMQQFAATPLDAPPMPDAAFLWWKAQLLRRWDAERRAVAPIEQGERVQAVIGIAGAVVLIAWLVRFASRAPLAPAIVAPVIAASVLLAAAAVFVVWGLRAET